MRIYMLLPHISLTEKYIHCTETATNVNWKSLGGVAITCLMYTEHLTAVCTNCFHLDTLLLWLAVIITGGSNTI